MLISIIVVIRSLRAQRKCTSTVNLVEQVGENKRANVRDAPSHGSTHHRASNSALNCETDRLKTRALLSETS